MSSINATPGNNSAGPTPAKRNAGRLRLSSSWMAIGLAATALGAGAAGAAFASNPPPAVGQSVTNPVTGLTEVVTKVISPSTVLTNKNNVILLAMAVGDKIDVPGAGGGTYTVTAITKNGKGDVISVDAEDVAHKVKTFPRVEVSPAIPPTPSSGTPGTGTSPLSFPSAAGDISPVFVGGQGARGGDGHAGFGVDIDFGPFGHLHIAYDPTGGGPGVDGPDINATVDPSSLTNFPTVTAIDTVSDKLPGVTAQSIGGVGGDGGDAGGVGIHAGQGGTAGRGGTVILTSNVKVTTGGVDSYGVFAQSAAGRGGSGGGCYVACTGGQGGPAAQAGTVLLTNTGTIITSGKHAIGLLAQSLGGAAGGGGDSFGLVSDGGGGNQGGNGNTASVINYGRVQTTGDFAYGIQAQSVGGSGGNAGDAGGLFTATSSASAGGNGGDASITAKAGSTVLTGGVRAHGLFAESIGGGGGSGGLSVGLATLGSNGGAGGDGGAATIIVEKGATVGTRGNGSHGIFVQSVGGGGGDSGVSAGLVTIGGGGDKGGKSGTATVDSDGVISTEGLDARGIFAQSVGGGGGSAAGSGGIFSIGGSGSAGGRGGDVSVTARADGQVTTLKDGSDGIYAQSVGGGGGSGGTTGGLVSLGGKGSGGGIGGAVTVTNDGFVQTVGKYSHGIFAQSVGGGGGSGGDAGGLAAIGGEAGPGSMGGDVTVRNAGLILTQGAQSSGLQAQSIGGGGGDGGTTGGVFLTIGGSGSSGGDAGHVVVNHVGNITTTGNDSHGIFAQAVGGGGGNGGASHSVSAFAGVAIGGDGANGGKGGNVELTFANRTATAAITTAGDRSRGIFAQSVGGGGGSGGLAAQLSVGLGGAVSIAIGGHGAGGGAGGTVNVGDVTGCATAATCYPTVSTDLNITTHGDNSEGMYLQSVGGGGGSGGYSIASAVAASPGPALSLATGIGGSAGAGGAGGDVIMRSGGSISTGDIGGAFVAKDGVVTTEVRNDGEFSTGLLAQSVGGGGGKGGYNISASVAASGGGSLALATGVGGSGGAGGTGGLVDVDFDGTLITRGNDAAGALIQSVGGGGGSGGYNISASVAVSGGIGGAGGVGVGGSGDTGGAGGTAKGTIGQAVSTLGDRSTGVIVQSVGGGGGNGGFNVTGAIGAGGGAGVGIGVGVGGKGKGGGIGGEADGFALGTIDTHGNDSGGLLVQSIGGGGGNGGFNVTGAGGIGGGAGGAVAVGVGGSAGTGSQGGYAHGEAKATVTTAGDRSVGVTVQSLGGGGGDGGFNVSGSIGAGGLAGGGISVGVGGSGAGGGAGGEVLGRATSIGTTGADSGGFMAQSVGGGGGNGGFSVGGSIGGGGEVGGAISVSIGGSGSNGGDGGHADGATTGLVSTTGVRSVGVTVQSLGGGGGNGGFSVAGGIGGGGTAGGAISVGLGGSGGKAGNGGLVDGGAAAITTTNSDSTGFLAQSVGGGGGNGGFAVAGGIGAGGEVGGAISVGIGGSGAGGGTGGHVNADVTGDVNTRGSGSSGVIAQSLGGGGGNGGFAVAGGIGGGGTVGGAISVGLGGSGSFGGGGGEVIAKAVKITTAGDSSGGFLAQSVGGGGGNGGFSVAGGIGAGGEVGGAISVSIGGSGGGGGDGAHVDGRVSGEVVTGGKGSTGVTVQSIGGGGGNGGFSVAGGIGGGGTAGGAISVSLGGGGGLAGNGGDVDAAAKTISTLKDNSGGFLAQSAGGGGGNGGFSVAGGIGGGGTGGGAISVGIGGSGAGGGTGHRVTADLVGDVYTGGAASDGIVAQSLGGGGGNGGFTVAGSIGVGGTGGGAVSVGVGGSAGGGGDAGKVALTVTGITETMGAGSDGIIAQSVGGGGGNGGFAVTGNIAAGGTGAGSVGVSVGGSGGDGGNSSDGLLGTTDAVTLNVNGTTGLAGNKVAVVTHGDTARGILAQSVGGGGGNGGFTVTGNIALAKTGAGNIGVGVGGSGGTGGTSGIVTGNVTGDVTTLGASDATGVLVQSIGGGGGNGGFNISAGIAASTKGAGNLLVGVGGMGGDGGASGAVYGTVTGNVMTTGINSGGVTYQSLAGGGGNGAFNVTGGIALTGSSSGGAGNIGVGVGGFGGKGSNAALVDAASYGNITTVGTGSWGALFQSVGGGGGSGGFNITGTLSASAAKGGSLGFGLGGFGGGGGNAGDVTAIMSGIVQTTGDGAYGVTMQSLGGGGGNGGFNVTGAATFTSGDNGSIGIGVGGFGGQGGHAGNVLGTVTGAYSTTGVNADGVVVQSLGGGGGNGGLNVTAAVNVSAKGKDGQANIGVGGFGGDGGASGTAFLTRTGDTQTTGLNSEAIIVQSLAGGGGNGAINVSGGLVASSKDNAALNFGLGGFGGKASNADAVTANIYGNVWATGLNTVASGAEEDPSLFSGAVVAQSVGGGGGTGGLNVAGGISLTKSASSGKVASIGIGGFGGGGGNGGTVDLTLMAPGADRVQVVVNGDNRAAIIAQSLGGGGGLGGINVSGGIASNSSLVFGMGGFGGDGGLAKDVTAHVDADIFATGDGGRGLFVQSLGGGGGAGGINVSGLVSINNKDDTSITFGLGGFGGAGNISGNVLATQKGQISVTGKNAMGILAQSIAGGGGDGGLNVSANITNATADKTSNRIIAGVGGSAGTGANAGTVTLGSVGNIAVHGPDGTGPGDDPDAEQAIVFTSAGILAQSIGGGGGTGGMNVSASVARNAANTLQFGMGGNGGTGGNAGTVDVNRGYEMVAGHEVVNASQIWTHGDYSSGLIAQSVGGGGGTAGMNFNFAYNKEAKSEDDSASNKTHVAAIISVGGSGANAGNAAAVHVRQNGDIVTNGGYSHGIVAQSIGGGGGSSNANLGAGALGEKTKGVNIGVGGANGSAGNGARVEVNNIGNILTQADWSIGLKAQSIGGGGGSASAINTYADPILDFFTGNLDSASLAVNIGRKGGTGGIGGDVIVTHDGVIETQGHDSTGIFAQSVGGGGGDSSTTTVGGDFSAKSGTYGGNVAIGLDGGEAAIGGAVTVTTAGTIRTHGQRASAIFAQSLGGGGGAGGQVGDKLALSTGDDEDTTHADLSIGGDGGKGSYSQQVTVNNSAYITTDLDRSDGIWAQSIGGTGGAGGAYLQANIENIKNGKTSRSLAINVGGKGGTGAVGGGVKVTNANYIGTLGELSFGIRAESIGGGGGEGGAVEQATLLTGTGSKQSIDINVGGKGGEGGKAGLVEVGNTGIITTTGRAAEGIRATSIGGGGGNAGVVLNTLMRLTGTEAQTQAFTLNIGGDGGKGGTGGVVKVDNLPATGVAGSGTIWTKGESAHGIFAQSLGGGGGNGSSVVSVTGLRSSADSMAIGLNFGGKGGSGNTADSVTVTNGGAIQTEGKDAYGILAQSTGGGGGNGGLTLAASVAIGEKAGAPILAIGGFGGDGGNGGAVRVTNTGTIYTTGAGGHGIVAQSIGGGGGNAGMGLAATNNLANVVVSNLISLAAGATGGGKGGIGGTVDVINDGDITVTGDGARAVVAQSINGGGGSLKFDLDGIVGMPGSSFKALFKEVFDIQDSDEVIDPKIDTILGGVDLSDMNAGKVTVTGTGTYGAGGNNSVALFDQSIGGGGGTLYLKTRQVAADSLAANAAPRPVAKNASTNAAPAPIGPAAIAYQTTLGGSNGVNNNGGDIDNTHSGGVMSSGVNAPGMLTQTIGGGGGLADMDITADAGALVGPITLNMGSTNGTTEKGGAILRTQDGRVQTTGDLSAGVIMQSIGGGGGSAGIVVHQASSLDGPIVANLTYGAHGGTGLDGGAVNATFIGGISTTGDHAVGLIQQSIGAGGGQTVLSGIDQAHVTLGGTLGATGQGGDITLANTGNVWTQGNAAHGVFLQSIGGGGGSVFGANANTALALNANNTGDGGAIAFTQTGSILASGAGADGLVAQTLGGGGGWVDGVFAGTAGGTGHGGTIDLTVHGDVVGSGAGASAIFAQSLGSLGAGNITGTSTGFIRGNLAGLNLDGGASNSFTSDGSISAVSGLAINTTTGDDRIHNNGLVVGNIDLGSGNNLFANHAGATFIALNTIDLRDGTGSVPVAPANTFVNDGDFQMGLSAPLESIDLAAGETFANLDSPDSSLNVMQGARVINQVALDGNFVQNAGGHLAFDVAFGPYASDKVTVTGQATVAGKGDVNLVWLENTNPVYLFQAAGGGTDNGLEITDTIALDYSVLADSTGIRLGLKTNFAQPFMNRNQRAVGQHMDSAVSLGGSGGIGRTMAFLANIPKGQDKVYTAVIEQLNPEPLVAPLFVQFNNARQFSGDLLKCQTLAGMNNEHCVWGRIAGMNTKRKADWESVDSDANVMTFETGFDNRIDDKWSVMGGVGYDDIGKITAGGGRMLATGNGFKAGFGARRTYAGGNQLGLTLSAGHQRLDSQRYVAVLSPDFAHANPRSSYVMARANFAHQYNLGAVFARPALNLSLTSLRQGSYSEKGIGGQGAVALDHTQTFATLAPDLTVGYQSDHLFGGTSSISFNIGEALQSTDRIKMPFRLAGANPAAQAAQISTAFDPYTLRYGADVQFVSASGNVTLQVGMAQETGKLTSNQNFSMNLRMKF